MINVLGLIEVHPFDGTEGFVSLRLQRKEDAYLFDLPLEKEQVEFLLANLSHKVEAPVSQEPPPPQEEAVSMVVGETVPYEADPDIRLAARYYEDDDDL